MTGLGDNIPFQRKSPLWQICLKSKDPGKVCLEISLALGARLKTWQKSAELKMFREKYFNLHGHSYLLMNASD